jgi:RNA polymerase sigma factor (TIGR02999 family)
MILMTTAITELFTNAERGDPAASKDLFAALYDELHRLAERHLARSSPDLSLGTTTLLHEAYLDMAGRSGVRFPDRYRFLAYASRAMRGLIIDYSRKSRAQKRGGGAFEITLTGDPQAAGLQSDTDLEKLSDALDELADVEPSLAQLVDLHFFCGFSLIEIASMRNVSDRTVQRDWRKARIFLHRALRVPPDSEGPL